jgi:hypothetical protein
VTNPDSIPESISEASRRFVRRRDPNALGQDEIRNGALQRIAVALELMSRSWSSLRDERDYYERESRSEREHRKRLERRVAALRGVVTRMKKKRRGRSRNSRGAS